MFNASHTRTAPAVTTASYTRSYSTGCCATRPAPTPVRAAPPPPPVRYVPPVAQTVSLDLASFSGGVGNGVDGGYYGGGGGYISVGGGARFSGVLSARASAYTFTSGGGKWHGGGKPGGGGCGCTGGGKGH